MTPGTAPARARPTPRPNPDYVQALRRMVDESGVSRCLGFRLSEIEIDACRVELDVGPHLFQPQLTVHGGVFATLIDAATLWATFLRIPQESGLVNIDLKLNYLKGAGEGRLIATGRCLRPGRQISYSECAITDAAGELMAHGTSTLMTLPGRELLVPFPKFVA